MTAAASASTVWFRWLLVVIIGVMLFGACMMLAPDLIRQFFSWLLYASPDAIASRFSLEAVAYLTLLHGVLGAVMFGWGALMLMVLHGPFRRGAQEGWNMLAISVILWFVPDTAFSVWTGFWQNALLNTSFAILFLIPLAATYPGFRRAAG